MRLLAAAALALPLFGACASVHIDYIDFIQHAGIQYVAPPTPLGRALTEADLGEELFRVRQTLSRGTFGPDYRPKDGDAAFVPAGDPVFAVRGYAPTFRLAARHDGRLVLYEADSNPTAKTGADVLDLEGKVASIDLLSERDGRTVLGRITDPDRVGVLTKLVLEAPVDQSRAATPGPRAFVGFVLIDGTATSRSYVHDPGILHRGILVGGTFRAAIEELQASAPTPTPLPAVVNLARRYDLDRASRVIIKGRSGFRQEASLVAPFSAALNVDIQPSDPSTLRGEYSVFIEFEFPDHYVSLGFEPRTGFLVVVQPEDPISVPAPAEFVRLLEATR